MKNTFTIDCQNVCTDDYSGIFLKKKPTDGLSLSWTKKCSNTYLQLAKKALLTTYPSPKITLKLVFDIPDERKNLPKNLSGFLPTTLPIRDFQQVIQHT